MAQNVHWQAQCVVGMPICVVRKLCPSENFGEGGDEGGQHALLLHPVLHRQTQALRQVALQQPQQAVAEDPGCGEHQPPWHTPLSSRTIKPNRLVSVPTPPNPMPTKLVPNCISKYSAQPAYPPAPHLPPFPFPPLIRSQPSQASPNMRQTVFFFTRGGGGGTLFDRTPNQCSEKNRKRGHPKLPFTIFINSTAKRTLANCANPPKKKANLRDHLPFCTLSEKNLGH